MQKFEITGMHCKSCKILVQDILSDLCVSVSELTLNEKEQKGILKTEMDIPAKKLIDTIEKETGYKVKLLQQK